MSTILKTARKSHFASTGHVAFVGANFIECPKCGKHAHEDAGRLILHGSVKAGNAIKPVEIMPSEF